MVGKVTAEFSADTGITVGTSVISAGGDQQCAAVDSHLSRNSIHSYRDRRFFGGSSGEGAGTIVRDMICNCAAVNDKYIMKPMY